MDKLQKYAKAFFLFDCSSHSPRLWYRVAICAAGLVVSLILTLRHSPLCFLLYGLVFFFYLFVFRKQSKRYQKAVKTATLEECLRPFLKNISYLEKDGLDSKAILNAGNIRKSAIFSGLQMPRIRACKLSVPFLICSVGEKYSLPGDRLYFSASLLEGSYIFISQESTFILHYHFKTVIFSSSSSATITRPRPKLPSAPIYSQVEPASTWAFTTSQL